MKFVITNHCAEVAEPKLSYSITNKIQGPWKCLNSLILIYIKVPFWLWSRFGYSFKFSHIASFSSQVERVAKLASPMGRFKALLYEVLMLWVYRCSDNGDNPNLKRVKWMFPPLWSILNTLLGFLKFSLLYIVLNPSKEPEFFIPPISCIWGHQLCYEYTDVQTMEKP